MERFQGGGHRSWPLKLGHHSLISARNMISWGLITRRIVATPIPSRSVPLCPYDGVIRRQLRWSRAAARGAAPSAQESSPSLYDILGVPPTASERDIKRAYRKLALKYHPDVSKAPDAQQKFMSIKNAYQTLVDIKTRTKYDSGRHATSNNDGFTWGSSPSKEQEEFYGIDDFFRDLEADFRKAAASGNPKSLWEELAEIGEEFVEFLEKELKIDDSNDESTWGKEDVFEFGYKKNPLSDDDANQSVNAKQNSKKEENDIEDMLSNLKKEMGL